MAGDLSLARQPVAEAGAGGEGGCEGGELLAQAGDGDIHSTVGYDNALWPGGGDEFGAGEDLTGPSCMREFGLMDIGVYFTGNLSASSKIWKFSHKGAEA